MDTNSLAHTKWNCKYHIVFAPKYRRKEIYAEKWVEIGKILRKLYEWKGVELIEANVCIDHIYILVAIPPKISVSSFIGFLKGKSSIMIFDLQAWNTNMGIDIFGVEDTMLIQLEKIKMRYKNI